MLPPSSMFFRACWMKKNAILLFIWENCDFNVWSGQILLRDPLTLNMSSYSFSVTCSRCHSIIEDHCDGGKPHLKDGLLQHLAGCVDSYHNLAFAFSSREESCDLIDASQVRSEAPGFATRFNDLIHSSLGLVFRRRGIIMNNDAIAVFRQWSRNETTKILFTNHILSDTVIVQLLSKAQNHALTLPPPVTTAILDIGIEFQLENVQMWLSVSYRSTKGVSR